MKNVFFLTTLLCVCLLGCNNNKKLVISEDVQRFEIDDYELFAIRDSKSQMPATLFVNADSVELEKLIPSGFAEASTNVFLLQKDGRNILFDAGNGGERGSMLVRLDEMGISPNDIDAVLVTHFHGDHIGGLLKDGNPVFSKAEIYVSQAEYDAWANPDSTNNYAIWVSQVANTLKTFYGENFHLFQFEDVIFDDIIAHSAIGHTPGHTVFEIGNLLIVGDIIHGAATQLVNPDICARYDADFEKAVDTRKQYLDYAAQNKKVMVSMHMPFPGVIEDYSKVWKK